MPPVTVKSATPLESPLHNIFVPLILTFRAESGSVIVTQAVAVHKLKSVTVTQYVPPSKLLKSSIVSVVFHQ
ncbi:hypothetical protein ES703_90735 [subsurface metagenome]